MRFTRRNVNRNVLIVIVVLFLITYVAYLHYDIHETFVDSPDINSLNVKKEQISDRLNSGKEFRLAEFFPETLSLFGGTKRDWHNYTFINEELRRTGPGEQGLAAPMILNRDSEKTELIDTNGFDALLSDTISLHRSLTDIRHEQCKSKKYNRMLPTVSVVIPYFEEHWTTLLRTVVSIINRTPTSLLKEIILVDDGSTMKEFLGDPLDKWMAKHYKNRVRVIHLPERVGLIGARQVGAQAAIGEVLVVLDSHCEVMVGWLPPLLEPIVENPRVAVCPLIDVINHANFAYAIQDNGARGAFDWRLYYKRLPLPKEVVDNLPEPFENPVMNGGLFAINLKFFWELGGYDNGLKIWGGEQYNLSFKIWMCGGRLLDAPCSRVGHIFRHGGKNRPAAKNAQDFLNINYKRVAVAWMDDYIEALYRRNKHLRDVKEGDLSAEFAIKKKLQCKSFKWYLENVAPDLLKMYPPQEPPDFANGTIQSVENKAYCVDTASRESGALILYSCHGQGPQYFALSYNKAIKIENEQFCWITASKESQPPELGHCQKEPSDTFTWRYDPESKTLQDKAFKRCLQANINNQRLTMETCSPQLKSQQWNFGYVNTKQIHDKFPPF